MKFNNIYIILYLSAAAMMSASCNDYLKEDSADLLIPETVEDYIPILRGEGYPTRFGSQISFVHLMTDDVEMGPLYYDEEMLSKEKEGWQEGADPRSEYGEYAHRWQDDYSIRLNDDFWAGRYSNILGCNTIIKALPEMRYTENELPQYRKLAAQAYTLRAYNYFCLVNTYALPYSAENLNKPGVVLRTIPDIEISPRKRSSIKETYDLINNDLLKAKEYIAGADSKGFKYEISEEAIYFLACRVALFQEDWDGVIAAGEKFLAKNAFIRDLGNEDLSKAGIPITYLKTEDKKTLANDAENGETVFVFGQDDAGYDYGYLAPYMWYQHYEFGYYPSRSGNNQLMGLYDEEDLRMSVYFARKYYKTDEKRNPSYIGGQNKPLKYDHQSSNPPFYPQAWRTPEVYLNMAEAYARKTDGISTEAIDLINRLRVKKFKAGSSRAEKSPGDFNTKDDLVHFIWEERRRELCFEEIMRFWDLRRQGMPQLTHRVFDTKSTYKEYILPQGSPNYVLPIPTDETDYNDAIENNGRVVINAASEGSIN